MALPASLQQYRIDLPSGQSYLISADHELSPDELRAAVARLGELAPPSPTPKPSQGPYVDRTLIPGHPATPMGQPSAGAALPNRVSMPKAPDVFDPTTSSTAPPGPAPLTKEQLASQARGEYVPPENPAYRPLPAQNQHVLETQRLARINGIPWSAPDPSGGDNWSTYDNYVRNVASGTVKPAHMETWNADQGTGAEHIQKGASALSEQAAGVLASGLRFMGLNGIADRVSPPMEGDVGHEQQAPGEHVLAKSLALANPLQWAATAVGVVSHPGQAAQAIGDSAQNIATGKGTPEDFLNVGSVVLPLLHVAAPDLVPTVRAHIENMLPVGKTDPAMVGFLAKGGNLGDVESAVRTGETGPKAGTTGVLPQPAEAPPPIGPRTELSPDLLARRPGPPESVAVEPPAVPASNPALPKSQTLEAASPPPFLSGGTVPNPRGRFFALADELGLPGHVGADKQVYYDFAKNVLGRDVTTLSQLTPAEWTTLANAMQDVRAKAGAGAFAEPQAPASNTITGLAQMAETKAKAALPEPVDMAAARQKAISALGPGATPEELAQAVSQVREAAAPGAGIEGPKPLPSEEDPFAAFAEPKPEPGTSVAHSKKAGYVRLSGGDIQKVWEAFDGITRNSKLLGHLSAPFMQGRDLLMVDPKAWMSGWKPMFEGLAKGDAGAAALRSRMEAHPLWNEFAKSGGEQILSAQHGPKSGMEEIFAGDWGSNIPGFGKMVEHSSATFNGFLNAARFQAWTDAMEYAPPNAGNTRLARRQYANEMVNAVGAMTGRSTSALATKARNLSSVAFSPGYKVSTIENNLALPAFKAQSVAGKAQISKMYARRAAGYASLALGAKAMGFKVHVDPRDSEFGFVDLGKNNHVDLFSRAGDTVKYLTRAFVGRLSASGKAEGPSLKDTAWNYAQNEATPMVRAGINLTQGERDWKGQQTRNIFGQATGEASSKNPPKFSWSKFASDLVEPISEGSVRTEASKGATLAPLNVLGISTRAPYKTSGGGAPSSTQMPGMPRMPSTKPKLPGLPGVR